MKSVQTFTASIYVGRKVRDTGEIIPLAVAQELLHAYCDTVGLCVTLAETEYIYSRTPESASDDGGEPGFVVGLINYPRFPTENETIRNRALAIAESLLRAYKQYKVSVVFPDDTVMLERAA